MKTILLIFFIALLQIVGFSQTEENSKSETVNFKVYGNCGMCKNRIEKALKVEGVESSVWDVKTKMVEIKFDSNIIKEDELHNIVANVGHDTDKVLAKDEVYNKLHGCCKYERRESLETNEDKQ